MGWFWADPFDSRVRSQPSSHPAFPLDDTRTPPPGCPMHKHQKSADAMTPPSSCPVKHDRPGHKIPDAHLDTADSPSTPNAEPAQSTFSKLNPLNYMFRDLSQDRAPDQTYALPTSREPSTIPRGDGAGNWQYPSPQQMYNAMLRKGYADTDVTAVEGMVGVHNFLNEGAWAEIVEWERRFAGGLYKGWRKCSRGEDNVDSSISRYGYDGEVEHLSPSLVRFQGRPKDMTPKAAMIQVMGWLYPSAFGTEAPFDRHDWFVSRDTDGRQKEVRYVIDYYEGPPEQTGEPVFFLDVRPAFTVTGATERAVRWGCDLWWRASGGEVREKERLKAPKS